MSLDAAVVSHGTDAFLLNLLESVREHVPAGALGEVHVLDNASPDRSLDVLARFSREVPWLAVHASPVNLHHGPALDTLLRRHVRADHVLLLDADAEVTGDFLPRLLPLLSSRPAFVGQEHPEPDGFYLYLCHLLVDRRAYLSLPPFARHGAPGLALFAEVARRRLPVSRFRWVDHVRHHGQAALRALRARGESGNELFAFASRQPEASPRRLALEARLAERRDAFLRGEPLPPRPRPEKDPWPLPDARSRPRPRRPPLGPLAALLPWLVARAARRLASPHAEDELARLHARLRRQRPGRVLLVGPGRGGSLLLLSRAASPDARLACAGLPPWEVDDPAEEVASARLESLALRGQTLRFLRADALDPATAAAAREALGGEADLVFLDEAQAQAHAPEEDVESLLRLYLPHLSPGGTLVLSGIRPGHPAATRFRALSARTAAIPILSKRDPGTPGIGLSIAPA